MDEPREGERQQTRTHRCKQVGDIDNPEDRAAEQEIAQGAAAERRDQGDDDNAEQIDRLAPGFEDPGRGKDSDRQQPEFVSHASDLAVEHAFMGCPNGVGPRR